LQNW